MEQSEGALGNVRPRGSAPEWIDKIVDIAIAAGVVILILVGFVTSYRTLRDLAVTVGGYPLWLAPAIPLSFDLGIVVLSLKVVRAAREGRAALALRFLVALLSISSVIANASSSAGLAARLLHAVPPAMFVVCFESVVVTMRRNGPAARGDSSGWSLARHGAWLWLLAPRSTWSSWRQDVISATDFSHRDRDSTELHDTARPVTVNMGSVNAIHRIHEEVSARDEAARRALQSHPGWPAAALADHLSAAGYRVSLRTAQRIRQRMVQSEEE